MNASSISLANEGNRVIFEHLKRVAGRCLHSQHRKFYHTAMLRAMKSVRDCPTPIESVEDALKLPGIGPAVAKEIGKVTISSSGNGLDMDGERESNEILEIGANAVEGEDMDVVQYNRQTEKRKRNNRAYKPDVGKVTDSITP
jgi:hypothetical protein